MGIGWILQRLTCNVLHKSGMGKKMRKKPMTKKTNKAKTNERKNKTKQKQS